MERLKKDPNEKYYYPELSSWEYFWDLDKLKPVLKSSEHCKKIKSVFQRNGVKNLI